MMEQEQVVSGAHDGFEGVGLPWRTGLVGLLLGAAIGFAVGSVNAIRGGVQPFGTPVPGGVSVYDESALPIWITIDKDSGVHIVDNATPLGAGIKKFEITPRTGAHFGLFAK